ncbi:apolipoprotein N-acyltransferase [Treponema rectale]|uniref:Apolipoprotein N-acyltransferase n=1 Tax=Treponema rectale TaxID=744512 RepID=A0A7M1XJG7_9SPIR|nr:apolipoprotein N-acyltransferase [Treponema rectale]QOS39826.1 apolipoprotein N-acyltransferase [Treponema rectale]
MISFILQVFCSVFSGLALSAAIPSSFYIFGIPSIGLIALIPLYTAICRSRSFHEAFFLTSLQVLTVHLTSCWWLGNFRGFGIFALGASALGTAFEGGCCGLFFFALLSYRTRTDRMKELAGSDHTGMIKRSIWFALCYTAWEYIKSTGSMGFPWGTIFMSSYRWKLITQVSDITGVWGITFLFSLTNAAAAEAVQLFLRKRNSEHFSSSLRQLKSLIKLPAFLFLLCLVYGTWNYLFPGNPVKHVNTVIVQQNRDPWETDESETLKVTMNLTSQALENLNDRNLEADLVLWSEGVLSHKFPGSEGFYQDYPAKESLSSFIKNTGTPFIIGGDTAIDRKRHINSNSAIFYDAKGKYSGFYSKMQLVPFAEYIPFSDNAFIKYIMDDVVQYGSDGWEPGFQHVLFKIPLKSARHEETPLNIGRESRAVIALDKNGNSDSSVTEQYKKNKAENPDAFFSFTTPICFEDSFTAVCRQLYNSGSEAFMNITNDSWSKTPVAEYQHFVVASFLAIEYRTTLVRCCNSGYSAVILPNGKIAADLMPFTTDAMAVSVPVYQRKPTVFAVFGDYFALSAIFIIIAAVFLRALKEFISPEKLKVPASAKIKICIVTENKAGISTDEAEETESTGPQLKEEPESKKPGRRKTGKTVPSSEEKEKKSLPAKKSGRTAKKTSETTEKKTVKKGTAAVKKTSGTAKKDGTASKKPAVRRTQKKTGDS